MRKLTRSDVIGSLIDDDIDTITQHYEVVYLSDILREGFKGYNNYTNKELKQEYEERLDPDYEGIKVIGRRLKNETKSGTCRKEAYQLRKLSKDLKIVKSIEPPVDFLKRLHKRIEERESKKE